MNNTTRVTDFLDQFDIAYQYFQHPGPVYSLEQAASERQQSPSQVVRSILFRISQGDYVMVLVAAQSEISIGSGVRGSTVIMKTTDLLLALDGAELGTFAR
jgi:prolyl-tRNA editing enzyme YbaK/EbsC (Cys-tRNA(Pro) deacylase)